MPVAPADPWSVHSTGGPPIGAPAPLLITCEVCASYQGWDFRSTPCIPCRHRSYPAHPRPTRRCCTRCRGGGSYRANLQPLLGDARIRTRLSMSRSDTSRDRGHRRSAVQKARCAHSRPASNKRRVIARKTSDDLDRYDIVVEGARSNEMRVDWMELHNGVVCRFGGTYHSYSKVPILAAATRHRSDRTLCRPARSDPKWLRKA